LPRTPEQGYGELTRPFTQTAPLESCSSVLGWDEQTYMPPGGAAHRANQLSLLAGMCHERATSPEIGELIAAVEGSPLVAQADSVVAANIREARRDYNRATKLPRTPVEEPSHTWTFSQQALIRARK